MKKKKEVEVVENQKSVPTCSICGWQGSTTEEGIKDHVELAHKDES